MQSNDVGSRRCPRCRNRHGAWRVAWPRWLVDRNWRRYRRSDRIFLRSEVEAGSDADSDREKLGGYFPTSRKIGEKWGTPGFCIG